MAHSPRCGTSATGYAPASSGAAEALDAELRASAAPLLAGAYPVAEVPHRGLCATCPGRAGLCSYPPELTDRELSEAASAGAGLP